MKKRVLRSVIAMLLAVVMVSSGLPVFSGTNAKAAPLSVGQTFSWDPVPGKTESDKNFSFAVVGENEVELISYTYSPDAPKEISVPSEVVFEAEGVEYKYTVVGIHSAFTGNEYITKVVLPETVKKLEYINDKGAFEGCINLESVVFPGLEEISKNAFKKCESIKSITLPSTLKSIGEGAFIECTKLENINLSELSITEIADYTFTYCTGLSTIQLPDTVTTIGKGAFYNCRNLNGINISESVVSIGEEAFYGCENLIEIEGLTDTEHWVAKGLTTIPYRAFFGCNLKGTLTIPKGVTEIGGEAFCGNKELKAISFESGSKLESISANAFKNCIALSGNLDLPEGIKNISADAFSCAGFDKVVLPASLKDLNWYFMQTPNPPAEIVNKYGSVNTSYINPAYFYQ